jgi:hypothetical protein
VNERAGPKRPASAPVSSRNVTARMVPDRDDHRRRQAVIAQVQATYGVAANLQLTPLGPACCPDGCPWCGAA